MSCDRPGGAEEAIATLRGYQREVDALLSYEERVHAATKHWDSKRKNKPLEMVREMLGQMCPGDVRCMYCEDSRPSQVEHFRPKSLYPDVVFDWANFLYACEGCNGPDRKGSRFKVFRRDGAIIDVSRRRGSPILPPEEGASLLLDPRHDDPLEFIYLDLDTGWFGPIDEAGMRYERAHYTIDVLGLNDREFLVNARQAVFEAQKNILKELAVLRHEGVSPDELRRKEMVIRRLGHWAVWREMKRQRLKRADLHRLFTQVPDAMSW